MSPLLLLLIFPVGTNPNNDLAMVNQIDRFNLTIDVIDRVPKLHVTGAHVKDWLKNQLIENTAYAYKHGVDEPGITGWAWPAQKRKRSLIKTKETATHTAAKIYQRNLSNLAIVAVL